MFCTNCGKELPNESKFCQYCGLTLDNDNHQAVSQGNIGPTMSNAVIASVVVSKEKPRKALRLARISFAIGFGALLTIVFPIVDTIFSVSTKTINPTYLVKNYLLPLLLNPYLVISFGSFILYLVMKDRVDSTIGKYKISDNGVGVFKRKTMINFVCYLIGTGILLFFGISLLYNSIMFYREWHHLAGFGSALIFISGMFIVFGLLSFYFSISFMVLNRNIDNFNNKTLFFAICLSPTWKKYLRKGIIEEVTSE